ncbi:chromate transporter [Longirhabdus pacifica]|uniref:chromate transporter n=1 Tax=Longirhabdus pacifica TaxID=2305227 RepID=UPI0010093053|nr:chromate transporter [Longirhabdus pacifica]
MNPNESIRNTELFTIFTKMSPLLFGGGFSMIPLIEKAMMERRKWISPREMAEIIALAESVPGAIAINCAAIIGYRLKGIKGAIVSMLGVVIPTFLMMIVIGIFFLQFKDHPKVAAAFQGIRAAIVAIITYAAWKVGRTAILDKTTLAIAIASIALLYVLGVHPALMIILGMVTGIVVVKIRHMLGLFTTLEHEERKYKYRDYYIGDGI